MTRCAVNKNGPAKRVPDLNLPICIDDDDYEYEEYDDITILERIPSSSRSVEEVEVDRLRNWKLAEEDRLRKRKLAETERMLEVQRRQRQRVEELRNARKKDEEVMLLKDRIREEVRNKLDRLQKSSGNKMASALRLLGIKVDGWPKPSTEDIHKAYKKALHTFHPDRQLGILEKAEAEEILKFVIDFKKKFGLSCRTYP